MDFGRINDVRVLEKIKWELPSLESEDERLQLARLQRAAGRINTTASIRIGTPVWSEPEWVGKLFPPLTKSENFLKEYAKQFSAVEINSTFYAVPSAVTFQKWVDSVPENFRFCPKFPQTISRSLQASVDLKDFQPFIDRVKIIGPRLGCSFLQLPPDLSFASLQRLGIFFAKIPRELKTMVEFRHESFFHERRLKPEVVNLLASHHLGTVITDTAQFRSLAHVSLSSTRVLLRFAASNGHPSDYLRIDQWVERLALWAEAGLKEIYVTTHAKLTLPEIEVARYFIQQWNEKTPDISLKFQEPVFYHELQGVLF